MFIIDIGLQFSFSVASLSGFGIRVMVASWNEFGSLPSSAIFWKSLNKIDISSSLNFWQNSPVKPSGPGLFFLLEDFNYSFDFCSYNMSVKIFYFIMVQFQKLYFLKKLSISSKLSILLAQSCLQQSVMILCISVLSVMF